MKWSSAIAVPPAKILDHGGEEKMAIFSGTMEDMAITLTDEQFGLVLALLDRLSQSSNDPKFVGDTIKLEDRVFNEMLEVAEEQGFVLSGDHQ
jgi:hypothetical protein